jgi:3-oxoacyl-[acyl-carrier protein] reductase
MNLAGKIIIVTGGAQGIGLAIAERCAESGASVAVWDNQEDGIAGALERIADRAPRAQAAGFIVDVSDLAAVHDAVKATLSRFGRIDGLVNNAGVVADAQISKMSEEQWDRVIDINLKGVFNCTRASVDALLASTGSIVNISSIVGVHGNWGQTNYGASKAGIIGFTKSLARELGSRNVRANVVAPGYVKTQLTDVLPEEATQTMLQQTPLGRLGDAGDVAGAVRFLCSDEASFITGEVLLVDGGLGM